MKCAGKRRGWGRKMNKNHLIGTKELTYDNAHKMKLEYFLISEDRERTRSLYGIRIKMCIRDSHRSADYSEIAGYYRPGHADYTFDAKYGFRDYRGGGRSSGRETIARVAAGAVAIKLLHTLGVDIFAYTAAIGGRAADPQRFSREEIRNNPFCMPDAECARQTSDYLKEVMAEKDSACLLYTSRCV